MNTEMRMGWFAMLRRVKNEILLAVGGVLVGACLVRGALVN